MIRFVRAASLAGVLIVALGAGVPAARAQQPPMPAVPPNSEAETLLRIAIEQLVLALGQALRDAPHYAAPELNPNGDIILRRQPPPPASPVDRTPSLPLDEAAI